MARPRKREVKRHERKHGQGSIKRVGPRSWRAWAPRGEDGTRPSKTFRSEAAAIAWLTERTGSQQPETIGHSGPDQPLGQYLEGWLRTLTLGPQTRPGYELAVLYAQSLWDIPLSQLTHRQFQQLFAELLRQSPRVRKDGKPSGPLAVSTVSLLRRHLSIALNAAVPDLLPANPIRRTRLPRPEKKDVPHWDKADANRFLRVAAIDSPLYAFFRLMLGIGARPGEVRGLKWLDLDLEQATVLIRRNLTTHTLIERPTKTATEREVDLPPATVAALRQHRAQQQRLSPWVFADELGNPLTSRAVRKEYLRVRVQAGVPSMILYGLRHTYATIVLDDGVPLPAVSEVLGHSNPSITARIYWRHIKSQRGLAARAIAAALP